MKNKSVLGEKNTIRRKLMSAFISVLLITVIVLCSISEGGLIVLRSKSEKQLIEQALNSAEVFSKGQAETISEQISGVISAIDGIALYADYMYANPDKFNSNKIPTTYDVPEDAEGNQMYWIYFNDEDANRQSVINDAYMLSNLEPEFESVMTTYPMITSLYVASTSHVNIGYDSSFLTKKEYGAYNPETAEAEWYLSPLNTGETYMSDTYGDVFDRGLMVTISVPYKIGNEYGGVIGADINIENITSNVLDIDMGSNSGYGMLFSKNGTPICADGMDENTTSETLLGGSDAVKTLCENDSGIIETTINGNEVYIAFDSVDTTGWKLAVVLSHSDIVAPAEESNKLILYINFVFIISSLIMLLIMWNKLNKDSDKLSAPLVILTEDVKKIGEGNLDYKSSIKTGDELQILSDSFENMTNSLKDYINNLTAVTAEKERIGAELDVAKDIQGAMLPCIFPPFPDRKDIDIYATMTPAKEVGGDFYDFFMIDEKHIAIVMADVSGKGVPAALFMVIGKTLIKDHTQLNTNLSDVFTKVNNLLCEANSEGLFITAFEGILNLETGEFNYVNAGHEMPFIYRKGEGYKPYKIKPGFVLAGMENMKYKCGSIHLDVGDKIFQYTDGVTEATNINEELYGIERLEKILNKCCEDSPKDTLSKVREDIDKFVGNAPQFDDITMLCIEYKNKYKA